MGWWDEFHDIAGSSISGGGMHKHAEFNFIEWDQQSMHKRTADC
jgi:hypothetical protein